MIDKLNTYMVMSARHGRREADSHYRISGKGIVTQQILNRVEVDHTPLDIIVVDEEGIAIGRPNCTCILDVYTQMPLGLYIGFEPPSELSVIHALRQAILPKAELIKTYHEIENGWPTYGIPALLVCDNGLEFHSKNLRRICAELNIELQFCPKQTPNYKGCVERFLGTLNTQVCHKLKGTTFSNINQRGNYDSVGLACITQDELKEMIYQWLVDVYCQSSHGDFEETPVTKWHKSRKNIEPRLPESKSNLDLILTREHQRKITHQ
ncbi:MAG: Mu transposase C-terminal domain-containing protein, partial [Wohlfahrtiimonas sp.]